LPSGRAAADRRAPPATRPFVIHARVLLIALIFGVGAYAVALGLIRISRYFGLLDWLQ
jgi:hypothetical protein